MAQTERFCTQCGVELKPGSRFCGSCGAPTEAPVAAQAAPAAPAPQPAAPRPVAQTPQPQAAPAETIVGMVPNLQQHKGLLGVKVDSYNLIVAPTRLIFVFVSTDTMKAEVAEVNREARGQGKKWVGIMAAQMGWLNRLLTKYTQMSIDEILSRYPGSFAINNAEIKKMRLSDSTDEDSNVLGKMLIETYAQKLRFNLISVQPKEAKRLLQQTLGPLVK